MTEQHQQRVQNWRLKVLRHAESTGNVAKTCRYYGISRTLFYQWRKRYKAEGLDGLRDRSHTPHRFHNATPAEIVQKILHLRQHYHFGPWRIHTYLLRYHRIKIGKSTVFHILQRHGLSRLPRYQPYKRYSTNATPQTLLHKRYSTNATPQTLLHKRYSE